MSNSIIKLGAADFDEAIAHLSLVFGDPNFAELVPALYERTDASMGCNLAVRRGGRIAAIVGVFPIDWVVGAAHLKLAGIGGVSVHPDFRGQGLMRLLMDAAMEEIARAGYHAACLGGNRRRYGHWGFEKAGVEACFTVSANSFHHCLGSQQKEMGSLRVREALDADFPAVQALYHRQLIRCERRPAAFAKHLRNWRKRPIVVLDREGLVAGYSCFDPKDASCVECCFSSHEALEAFLSHQLRATRQSLRLSVPLIRDGFFERLEELSDDVSLVEASNWRIYDWPTVIGALLIAKSCAMPLAHGTCVIKVRANPESVSARPQFPIAFRVTVNDRVICEPTDAEPDFEGTESQILRGLASPLLPSFSDRAALLLRWAPLPLVIPMQDRI